MVGQKEVKQWLLSMLKEKIDPLCDTQKLKRSKNSTVYKRNNESAIQYIEMNMFVKPKYAPESIAHIYPWVKIEIPEVNVHANNMVKDKILLANTPEITIRQPIDTLLPKEYQSRWLISGEKETKELGNEIGEVFSKWVFVFLDDYNSANGIVMSYEQQDKRPLLSEKWILYITASYIAIGNIEKAEQTLNDNFSRPGLRKKYESAFEYVSKLKS